jgi:hypothetical protein
MAVNVIQRMMTRIRMIMMIMMMTMIMMMNDVVVVDDGNDNYNSFKYFISLDI